jgi:hypothetical protein
MEVVVMSASTAPATPSTMTSLSTGQRLKVDPTFQAFWLLRIGFTVDFGLLLAALTLARLATASPAARFPAARR